MSESNSQSTDKQGATIGQPEPGWYNDPENPGQQRWWDGSNWGNQRRTIGTVPDDVAQQSSQGQTNGKAVAALVLGILWLGWIGSVLAVIFGHVAKREIDDSDGRQSGRGLAVAGLVLGWIGVASAVLVLVFMTFMIAM